jgi:hypothetical protein
MRHFIIGILCVAALASGCASSNREAAAPEAAAAPAAAKPIPPDSPLAKVTVGMTGEQVTQLIGQPTNEASYETGKRWIPWYFGDEARRTEWSYKGLGRVVFTGGNVWGGGGGRVTRVDYDPSETGVRTN